MTTETVPGQNEIQPPKWRVDFPDEVMRTMRLREVIISLVKAHHGIKSDAEKITAWDSVAAVGELLSGYEDGAA